MGANKNICLQEAISGPVADNKTDGHCNGAHKFELNQEFAADTRQNKYIIPKHGNILTHIINREARKFLQPTTISFSLYL